VAMTRAKKGLYFTSAEDYGGARKKKLSRFLIEMGFVEVESSKLKVKSSNALLEPKTGISNLKSEISKINLPDHFSYSQLAAYEKCPLQYKYNFILKVPIKGKAVFSFGKTMHATLYDFLKAANETNSKKQDDLFGFNGQNKLKTDKSKNVLDFKYLSDLYEKNWIDEWYENKKQKEDYHTLGRKIIKDFYEKEFVNSPDGGPKILKVENDLALELPFNLKIGDYTLHGVIDRMDQKRESLPADRQVEIVDYKTGQAKDKLDSESKEQLLIYQIAAKEIFKLKPENLTYFYLNDGKKISFLGSEKELDALKEKIIGEIEEIKDSNFEPTPGWQCSYCDFKDICDFAQR
jgi:DNA helicase-2/ATP-dependent DNA helicase PcrA